MRNVKLLRSVATLAVLAAVSACANFPGPAAPLPAVTTYPAAVAQWGRVTGIEQVSTQPSASGMGAGAVVGGLVGGLLGHQIGGGSGQDIATVAGVVGGALIGNAIEKNQWPATASQIYRVTVQLDGGAVRTFDYGTQPNVRVGDRVRLENNQLYR